MTGYARRMAGVFILARWWRGDPRGGQRREKSMVQFVSQVAPPSVDIACSHLGVEDWAPSHRNLTRIG